MDTVDTTGGRCFQTSRAVSCNYRAHPGIEALIIAALMLATSMPVGAVGPESDGSSTESARLSVTALDPLRPASEARIAVRWSGSLPEKISGWLDLDGD